MGVISAIKKYGLLISDGDGHKISEDAFNVFELPADNKEHIESLKKMAFTPQIFVELKETYGETLPSDQILRHYLIKNKFNPNVADEVIKNFRATIDLVTQAEESYNKNMKPVALQASEVLPPNSLPRSYSRLDTPKYNQPYSEPEIAEIEPSKELKMSLSEDSEVLLRFHGEINQPKIRKLIKLLEITFDLQDEPKPLQSSQPKLAERIEEKINQPLPLVE